MKWCLKTRDVKHTSLKEYNSDRTLTGASFEATVCYYLVLGTTSCWRFSLGFLASCISLWHCVQVMEKDFRHKRNELHASVVVCIVRLSEVFAWVPSKGKPTMFILFKEAHRLTKNNATGNSFSSLDGCFNGIPVSL